MPEITRRIRQAWAYYNPFKRELCDTEDAPSTRKVRMLKAEVVETLLHGCVTWTLGQEHFAELRTAHLKRLLRVIDFQRQQRNDRLMSYAKVIEKAQCESVETSIRKRRLLFAGPYSGQPMNGWPVERCFWTMADGENPGPGRAGPKELGPMSSRRPKGFSSHQ